MREKCEYCGGYLHEYDSDGNRTTRIDAKFDSDTCRDMYWADVRKIRRAYERAEAAIDTLAFLALKDNGVASIADTHLNMVFADIQRATNDTSD